MVAKIVGFFWLFEVTTVNSYILYKLSVPSPVTHFQFRQSVINALTSRYLSTAPPRPRPGRPPKRSLCDPERANTHQQHYLEKRQQRECVVCSNSGGNGRKRTMYYCAVCSSKPSLCPAPCFMKYHQNPSQQH